MTDKPENEAEAPPETGSETAAAAAKQKIEEIPLEQPIARGKTTIDTLLLRKPQAGELRGLQLDMIVQGDVNSIIVLLPRITAPPITPNEAEAMDAADLLACGAAIKGFFMTKAEQAAMARFMGIMEESTG